MGLSLLSVFVWNAEVVMPEEARGGCLSDMPHLDEEQVSYRQKYQMTDNKEQRKYIAHERIQT